MSYRAFKRLLGETSLERKCRFLFGGFILLLVSGSFWLYSRQTEHLAYGQLRTTCRLLVSQIIDRQLATGCRPAPSRPSDEEQKKMTLALDEFRTKWEEHWPRSLKAYQAWTIKPQAHSLTPSTDDNLLPPERLKEFLSDKSQQEYNQLLLSQNVNYYYGAIRASNSCLACHRTSKLTPAAEEDDLLAVVKIRIPTEWIAEGMHGNHALLISTAFVTAVLIMGGSYLIVRYVIVKPVKHLKEVSDAISAGELNVRSEIQTNDEFEDLSHAFNRMLRNLVSMQDRLRKVNADLDRKVDELAQANLALYDSARLKGDFLATMSHELRTPLTMVLGFSEVLLGSSGLTEKQKLWAKNKHSSGCQLLNLINDILDLAKIEAGKMQIRPVEFSAYDVGEGLLTLFHPMAEKKNIDLRGSFAPGIPLVRQDVVKYQQILSNLLSNAIKFTPEGGRVSLKVETEGLQIVLTVADTGVGIAPEEQELVFEKFRQSGNPLTREQGGTGLGLSIVRELCRILGGSVTLYSELGRGSTFTVRLPLQLNPEARAEFDLSHERNELGQPRTDLRLYGVPATGARPEPGNGAAPVL